jgi:hypothetical protein
LNGVDDASGADELIAEPSDSELMAMVGVEAGGVAS